MTNTLKSMGKTLIEKAFEDIREGDTLEITMSTNPFSFSLGLGLSYEIFTNRGGLYSSRARVDVRKTKIGYNINRFLDIPGKKTYATLGFSFTKDNADRRVHNYVLRIAQEFARRYGLKLVDRSQEDIAKLKKELETQ